MHSLNRYPDLIVVQIRKGHTLSQGQGRSVNIYWQNQSTSQANCLFVIVCSIGKQYSYHLDVNYKYFGDCQSVC